MSRLLGHIDEVARGRIRGWVLDERRPQERLLLDVFLDGLFLGQCLANRMRVDLKLSGIGDGFHAFEFRHPRLAEISAPDRIHLEVPRLGLWSAGFVPRRGEISQRIFRKPADYLQALFARFSNADGASPEGPSAASTLQGRLFAPVEGQTACLGRSLTAYQSYVMHRFRKEAEFDPDFTQGEFRRFLRWYVLHYGDVRLPMRIPISKEDIEIFNAPDPAHPERLQIATLFGDDFAGTEGCEQLEWALYNAASLGLADCLSSVRKNSVSPPSASQVHAYIRRHPVLRVLKHSDPTILNQTAALIEAISAPDAGQTAGPDGSFRRGRTEGMLQPVRNPSLVDVQLIGPFTKALGVGESCRRMAKSLALTGLSVRFCDFSIDYPNDSLPKLAIRLEEPGPARVNLIHLNLEEIPKIIAYWPDVFSDATNIGVPYLELSRLAPEQELGLALLDRVFAATHHIKTVIGHNVPIDVIGSAVELSPPRDRLGARRHALKGLCSDTDFVVLVSGDALSGLDRKNLMGSVRAFRAAFPDEPDRKLVIKTHSVSRTQDARALRIWSDICEIAAEDPRVILLDKHLESESYQALKAGCDVYLSLHRAEGLGYHVLECMQLGLPCVVTDYSGTRDFSTKETALPVGFTMVPVRTWEYPFSRGEQLWADPSIDEAVGHLRALALTPQAFEPLAERARVLVHQEYGFDAFARRLAKKLGPILSRG